MKYKLLLITLLLCGIGWGQNISEGFNSSGWGSSYGNYTVNGWQLVNVFRETSNKYEGSSAVRFNTSGSIKSITSPIINNGISSISLWHRRWSSSDGNIDYKLYISSDGINWSASLTTFTSNSDTFNQFVFQVNDINAKYIKIESASSFKRAVIDYIEITGIVSSTTTWSGTWSNSAPTASIDAIINGDLITTGNLACKDLTINSGKTLTIAAGTTLSVSGNLVNNGSIIFKSNNTSTGRFGSFTGTITGSGSVTAERYIDGKRAYRLLAPGVTTSSSIANNWQQQVFITGSTTGANGFDATATGNPSMYTYENSGWTPISNTNVLALNTTKGYRILIRGDRTPSILTNPSNGNMNTPVTLATTGTMTTGDVTYTTLSDQDYTLVANPYISPINWATVTKSGVSDTYYAWDPNLGTGNQRGRYVSCDIAGVTSIISGNGSPTSDVDQYIQPGQAFFIQKATSGVNGSITVKETDKAAVFTDIFRTSSSSSADNGINGKLGINLYESSAYSIGDYPIDGAVAVSGATFDTYSSNDDINKIMSHGEQVAFVRDNVQLGVEKVNIPQINDELSIASLNLLSNKSYIWNIVLQDDFSNESVYLYDAFTQNYHPLNFSSTTVVPFETTGDGSSTNINRFKIVFQNSALNTSNFEYPIGLHPNPSQGATGFYLSNMTADTKVALFTLLGQSVPVVTVLNGNTLQVLPKNSLSQGVYLVQVTSPEGLIKQVKWIVE